MLAGLPSEQSIFDHRTIQDIYGEICDVYRRYPQPWVIGYSGGKDLQTVLQLIWIAIKELPPEERQKPIFVIASDTKVETPVIVDYIDNTMAVSMKPRKHRECLSLQKRSCLLSMIVFGSTLLGVATQLPLPAFAGVPNV